MKKKSYEKYKILIIKNKQMKVFSKERGTKRENTVFSCYRTQKGEFRKNF